jgi:hypothetical protein
LRRRSLLELLDLHRPKELLEPHLSRDGCCFEDLLATPERVASFRGGLRRRSLLELLDDLAGCCKYTPPIFGAAMNDDPYRFIRVKLLGSYLGY